MEPQNHTLRGVLCTTIGGVFWGVSGACGQYLFDSFNVPAIWLVCVRMLISGVVLTLLTLPKERASLISLFRQPKELARVACFGIFGLMLCQSAYLIAISHSNAGTTTVLQNLNLVFIMLITCVQARKRPNPVQAASLLLALSGTYILATGGDPRHMAISGPGLFWGLLTAAAATIYTLAPRKLIRRWSKELITGVGMLIGGVFINLAARSWTLHVSLPWSGWLAVAAVVVLGSILAFPLFMQGIADVGPVKSSMLAATEPVSATICSALWLHTKFSLPDLIGFVFIIATIFLLAREDAQQEEQSEQGEDYVRRIDGSGP